jgi:hypothetical protein
MASYLYSLLGTEESQEEEILVQQQATLLSDSEDDDDEDDEHDNEDTLFVNEQQQQDNSTDNEQTPQSITSKVLTLHKDFNITRQINQLHNCNHIYAKLGFAESSSSRGGTRAKYLNHLIATEKKTEHFTRHNVALMETDDDDYGFFSASDLVDKNTSSSSLSSSQQQQQHQRRMTQNNKQLEEDVRYEEVDLEYFTVIELYNPYGVLVNELVSDVAYKEWWNKLRESRRKKSKTNSPQIPLSSTITKSSVRFFRSNEIVEDVTTRGRKIVACLQQPLNNSDNEDTINLSSTAAHNEGVYYIMMYVAFPNLEKQFTQTRTRVNNKKIDLVKKIARTDRFITSICINTNGKEDELCRYPSVIDVFSDDYVGNREGRDPVQLVGMFYYSSESDVWNFRATNDFAVSPPASIAVRVIEAKNLGYLISKNTSIPSDLETVEEEDDIGSATILNSNLARTVKSNADQSGNGLERALDRIDSALSFNRTDSGGGGGGGVLSKIQPHYQLSDNNASKIDTYCLVKYGRQKERTKTASRTQNPIYTDEFRFDVAGDELNVDIVQTFTIGSEVIGSIVLPAMSEIFGNDQKFTFKMRKPIKLHQHQQQRQRKAFIGKKKMEQQQQQLDPNEERPVLVHEEWYSLEPSHKDKEVGIARVRISLSLEY